MPSSSKETPKIGAVCGEGVQGTVIGGRLDEHGIQALRLLARQAEPRPARDWAPPVQQDDFVPPVPRVDPPPLPLTQPPLPPTGRTEPRISWQRR